MAEHFYAYQFPLGAADGLFLYLPVYLRHLVQVEFPGQDHHIREAGVETQSLNVRDIELGGEVNFHSFALAIVHHRYVACYHGGDSRFHGGIYNLAHGRQVLIVNDRVDGEIGLDAVLRASLGYFPQVRDVEMVGRMGTHIQLSNAEIYRVGSSLYGRGQRLLASHGSHYLESV